jgi:hypothetical protein
MKLFTFGDSWTYGSELENPQTQCWTTKLSAILNCESNNLGIPASSIPHMLVQLISNLEHIKENDICIFGLTSPTRYIGYDNVLQQFVNITSEAVYYTDIKKTGHPPNVVPHMLNFGVDFYKLQDSFEYQQLHVATAIGSLQKICEQRNIRNYYFSYFEDLNLGKYTEIVNTETILHNGKAIKTMLSADAFNNISTHPTSLGHIEIANILSKAINENQ